jgi:hypothetical protein
LAKNINWRRPIAEEGGKVPSNAGAAGEEAVGEEAVDDAALAVLSGGVVVRNVEAAAEVGRQTGRDCRNREQIIIKPSGSHLYPTIYFYIKYYY